MTEEEKTEDAASSVEPEFDVAVSFAGEDRKLVQEVVRGLQDRGLKVFYDEDFAAETWGEDLIAFFQKVYAGRARYAILFISKAYVEKNWPSFERETALGHAMDQVGTYVLPVRIDDAIAPGLSPTRGYLDMRRVGIEGVIEATIKKIGGTGVDSSKVAYHGRVPVTAEDFEQIIGLRPAGWEYQLFAGRLNARLDEAKLLYNDHLVEYAKPGNIAMGNSDALADIGQYINQCTYVSEQVPRIMNTSTQEAAFGAPGVSGDVDRIYHLADRLVDLHTELLISACKLRSDRPADPDLRDAYDALAHYADQPQQAVREMAASLTEGLQDLQARIDAGENILLEMPLKWNISDSAKESFEEAMARFRAKQS